MKYFLAALYFVAAAVVAEPCKNNGEINKSKEFGINVDMPKIREYGSVMITTNLVNLPTLDQALSSAVVARVMRGVRGLKLADKGDFQTVSALPAKFLITRKDEMTPELGYMKAFDVAAELSDKQYAVLSLMYFENPATPDKTSAFEKFIKEEMAKSICKM